MQNKKLILALALFAVFMAVWYGGKILLFPHREQTKNQIEQQALRPAAVAAAGQFVNLIPEPEPPEHFDRPVHHPAEKIALGPWVDVPPAKVIAAPPKKESRRISLGSKDPNSNYDLFVEIDSRGGSVRHVVLNKFQAVGDKGQPEWEDPETKKVRKLEELVPVDPNGALSYLLYHFDPKSADKDLAGEQPLETLGVMEWQVVEAPTSSEPTGTQRVILQARVGGVVIQKTYSLAESEYHLGFEVRMFKADPADQSDLWFRYQLAGAHGLPIEGRWYTSTFRNALFATVDIGNGTTVIDRDFQDIRTIGLKGGGDEVLRGPDYFIRYAAVGVQYFTSAIVVDDKQEKQGYLTRARPTLETTTVKGTISKIPDLNRFELTVADKTDEKIDFHLLDPSITKEVVFGLGQQIGVLYRTEPTVGGKGRAVAIRLLPAKETQPVFENDITVRVATEPINLKDAIDEQHAVVHKYLLYNGPMKPRLLAQLEGQANVSDELVIRYESLSLNTLIDYHSPGWMGREISSRIGWTWLVIKMTNLMHLLLGLLRWTGLPYGLCIICLTVMVRGLMFPISRKAAMTNIKMQELQPEIKKLKEKYKDDPQALNMAVWQFQRKAGVNPLSTCWLMFLQMPIFMGLYYALQESIHFRAAACWPTWVPWMNNLAAPDMLVPWGESIPFISAPESYGSFFYLGPYFNILPVIAVTLMIFQQKYTMPPPTDEQQAMQQKMMKYMMVFMGLMFYKVPSGLVLYFIASSVWGFCERKLLPKKKKPAADAAEQPQESFLQTLLSKPGTAKETASGVTTAPAGAVTVSNGNVKADGKGRNRVKQGKNKRKNDRNVVVETTDGDASLFQRVTSWWRTRRERMNDWWEKLREEAQKKNRL